MEWCDGKVEYHLRTSPNYYIQSRENSERLAQRTTPIIHADSQNMTCLEIERKFLVTSDAYKQLATHAIHIKQGYLSLSPTCTIRVRLWDDKGYLTVKSKNAHGSIAHFEWEKELTLDEATPLFALCVSNIIEKTRWIVPIANEEDLFCEVDEFMGVNKGLVLAEVELKTPEQSFAKPSFLGEEVTNDERYYNSYISKHPFTTW